MEEFWLGAGSVLILALIVWVWRRKGISVKFESGQPHTPTWMKPGSNVQVDTQVTTMNVSVEGLDDLLRAGKRQEAIQKLKAQANLPDDLAESVIDQISKAMGR